MPRIGLDLPILIQAAAELADSQGLEAVTLATLAQKLNIRSPSLYNHVKGLPELRRQLALSGLAQMTAQFRNERKGKFDDDAVRAFSSSYLSFARAHPGLYEAIQRAPEPDDIEMQAAGGEVVQLALDAFKGYGLEGDEAIHAVRGIRSLLHGFVTLERQGGFGIPLDLDVTFDKLIQTFVEGIKVLHRTPSESP